jgi:uncharacterized membrane protein YbhN (UPF0104 family)
LIWLRLGISLALLGVLAFVIADPRVIAREVANVRWPALVLALALTAIDRALMAGKWWMLLRARGVAFPLTTAVRAYFASSFAGLLLPVTVGADAIRVLALRQFGIHDITASIVVERTLGAVAMLAVGLVSCGLLARELTSHSVRPIGVALIAVAVLLGAAFPASLWLATWWSRRQAATFPILRRVADAYAAYAPHRLILVAFWALSVVESCIPSISTYVVARGLGFDIPFWLILATLPIALSVARLPVSLGGFGVQEVSFVYLAGLLGFGATDALATMLVTDAVLLLTLLPSAFDVSMLNLRRRPE